MSYITAEIIALKVGTVHIQNSKVNLLVQIEVQKDVELKQKSIEEERKEKLQQERIAALDKIFPPPYIIQASREKENSCFSEISN